MMKGFLFLSMTLLLQLISCNRLGLMVQSLPSPTDTPTAMPTDRPVVGVPTSDPTRRPTKNPTGKPSRAPTTRSPTSIAPTTAYPTSAIPTSAPTTSKPTGSPTESPTKTRRPTRPPTLSPTLSPVVTPRPTNEPTFNNCENYQGIWYNDANKIYLDCKSGYRCGKDIALDSLCFLEGTQTQTQLCTTNNDNCYRNSDCPSGRKCIKEDFCGTGRCFQYDESNITPYPTKRPTTAPTTSKPTTSPTNRPTQTPTTFTPTLNPSEGNTTHSPTTLIPTSSPTFKVADADLAVWQTFYDATGGSTWTSCQNTRDYPCDCNDRENLRYVVCDTPSSSTQNSGRLLESASSLLQMGNQDDSRYLQTSNAEVHITEIRLRNNNIKGSGASMPLAKLTYLKVVDLSSDLNSATPNSIKSTSVTNCEEFKYCYLPGVKCEFDGSGNDLCLKNWGVDPKYVLFAAGISFGSLIVCLSAYYVRKSRINRRRARANRYRDGEKSSDEYDEEEYDEGAVEEGTAVSVKMKSGKLYNFVDFKKSPKMSSQNDEEESLLPGSIRRKKSLIRTSSSKRLSTSERQRFKRVESLYEVGMLSNEEVMELVPDFFDLQAQSNMYTRKSSVRWVDKEGEKVPAGPISQVIKITDYENENGDADSVPVPLDSDEVLSTFKFKEESETQTDAINPTYDDIRRVEIQNPSTNPRNDIFVTNSLEKDRYDNNNFNNNNSNIDLDSSSEDDEMNPAANDYSNDNLPEPPQFRANAQRRASNTSSVSSTGSSTIVMSENDIIALAEKAQMSGQMVPEDKRPPISKIQFMLENDVITPEQASYLCPEFAHLRPAPMLRTPPRKTSGNGPEYSDSPSELSSSSSENKRPSIASIMSSGSNSKSKPRAERSSSLIKQALSILGIDEKAARRKSLSKQLERKRKLDIILSNQEVFTSFIDEHSRFFKAEHVLFWNSVDRFEKYRSLAARNRKAYQDMAQTVIDDFIKDGAPNLVILSDDVKDKILSKRPEQYTPELFVEAKREVMSAMNMDFLGVMQKSSEAEKLDEIVDQFEILVEDIAEQKKAEAANRDFDDAILPEGTMEKHDDDARVDILMGMGFTKRQSMRSLKAHNGDVDAAAQDLIFNHNNDPADDGNDDNSSLSETKVDTKAKSAKKPITVDNNPQESTPIVSAAALTPALPVTTKNDAQVAKLEAQSSLRSRNASLIPVPPTVPASLPQALVALANDISRRSTLTRDESGDSFSSAGKNEVPSLFLGKDEEESDPYDIDRFRTPSFDGHDVPRISSPGSPTSLTAASILKKRAEDKGSPLVSGSKSKFFAEQDASPQPTNSKTPAPISLQSSASSSAPTKNPPATASTNAQTTSIPVGKVSSVTQTFSTAASKPPAPPPPPPPPGMMASKKNANVSTLSTNNTAAAITPKHPAPPTNATQAVAKPPPPQSKATTTIAASTTPSSISVPAPSIPTAMKKQPEPAKPTQQQQPTGKPTPLNLTVVNAQSTSEDQPSPSPVAAAIKKFSAAPAKPATKPVPTPHPKTAPPATPTTALNTTNNATTNKDAKAPTPAAPVKSGSVSNAIQSLTAKQNAPTSAPTNNTPRAGSVTSSIQALQSMLVPTATAATTASTQAPAPTGPSPSIAASVSSYVEQPPIPNPPFDYNNSYPQQQQPYYDPNQAYYDPNQYGNVQQGYSQPYYDPNQQQQQYSAEYYQNGQFGSDPYNGGYQHGYSQSFDSGFYGSEGQSIYEAEAMAASGGAYNGADHQPRISGAKPAHVRAKEGVVSKQKQYFLEKQAQLAGSSRRPSKDPSTSQKGQVRRDSWWKSR